MKPELSNIIICGPQLIGKSTFIRDIIPTELSMDIQGRKPGKNETLDITDSYAAPFLIIEEVQSVDSLPVYLPEVKRIKQPYSNEYRTYSKPIIIALTNLPAAKFKNCRQWLTFDFADDRNRVAVAGLIINILTLKLQSFR